MHKTIMCIGEHIVKEWIMSMLALRRWSKRFKAHRNAADFDIMTSVSFNMRKPDVGNDHI